VVLKVEYALPVGFELEHYRIEKTIGGGGFSIVYLAIDTETDEKVIIKEYLPEKQATRMEDASVECISEDTTETFNHGIKRFFAEAASLAKIRHPNIVRVINFFRANNTVYLVMTYEKGKDLRWHIKRYSGRLSERFIRTVFPQLMEGLDCLHQNKMLHLDVKPANILLLPGGKPLLLDFGASMAATLGTKAIGQGPHTLTLGFAPLEQHNKGYLGPWSDIYAIGASMWACMDGKSPPSSLDRAKKDSLKQPTKQFARWYSKELLEAVEWCLQLNQLYRPQKIREVIDLINQAPPLPDAKETVPGYLEKLGVWMPWRKTGSK